MRDLIERLDKVTRDLVNEWGTDSYRIRCELYDIKSELEKRNSLIGVTYPALDRDGWPVVTESSKPCHTISNGIECYRCATCCAGLNNCELKNPRST